jgi:hypothetical protein
MNKRLKAFIAIFVIIFLAILACSCDYYQKAISKSKKAGLIEKANMAFDQLDDIMQNYSESNNFEEILRKEYEISCVWGSDTIKLNTSSYSAIFDVTRLRTQFLNNMKGYAYVKGTIPAPVDGIMGGSWLENEIDNISSSRVLNIEGISKCKLMVFFDPSDNLYEIAFFCTKESDTAYLKLSYNK